MCSSSLPPQYHVVETTFACAGNPLVLTHVDDTNALLDAITPEDFARDERLPYWAEVWASGIALGEFCLAESSLGGKRVLELGCGVGIAGIAAAQNGAEVVMTDYEPDALEFARWNAARNLTGALPEFHLLDWRRPSDLGRFDMILGADVIYDRANFLPLLQTIDRSLHPEGEVILSDPERHTAGSFLELARTNGFRSLSWRTLVHHREREVEVSIHRLHRWGSTGCKT